MFFLGLFLRATEISDAGKTIEMRAVIFVFSDVMWMPPNIEYVYF